MVRSTGQLSDFQKQKSKDMNYLIMLYYLLFLLVVKPADISFH